MRNSRTTLATILALVGTGLLASGLLSAGREAEAQFTYPTWPSSYSYPEAVCNSTGMLCSMCVDITNVNRCQGGPAPAMTYQIGSCGLPSYGQQDQTCVATSYNCGPLINCMTRGTVPGGCYNGGWCHG